MVFNRPDALNKSQTLKEASTSSFHISKNDEESKTKRPRHMIVIATMKSMGTNKKNKNKQTNKTNSDFNNRKACHLWYNVVCRITQFVCSFALS